MSGSRGPSRDEFREQLRARAAELERQLEAGVAQLEHVNERIKARSGRNLISAIAIGLALGAAVIAGLSVFKPMFALFVTVAAVFGSWELAQALRGAKLSVPRVPSALGPLGIVPATFLWHAPGQLAGFAVALILVVGWRLVEQAIPGRRTTNLGRDLAASVFVQAYVGFLASFAVLLTVEDLDHPAGWWGGGEWWTLTFISIVVAADTGAYAIGLTWGRHPMAPTISPRKSWEGFAGGAAASVIVGCVLGVVLLHRPWWVGLVFGAALFLAATLGDLVESRIKRDLGVKDMSSWLPGHGGALDRLDSMLPSAVVAYLLFLVLA